ncbi:hypothetical protein ACFP7A_13945 [Sporolactobacillus kofuensis]|uniref:Uncharacterized protein n=1 Tax=Sporolactobacillus kofuensis TaxID=269672 RepID=A0ABW1WGJ3_9BACL|nr:hypothetical protein [Sporolactobacillus kofuensis]MCO7177084.1 hypothetical protein [Sporolactobacillus kofuensis]
MNCYFFYLEYDGQKKSSVAHPSPRDMIYANYVANAICEFAQKNKMSEWTLDTLDVVKSQGYRVFFRKNRFLRGVQEFIYYVRPEGQEYIS